MHSVINSKLELEAIHSTWFTHRENAWVTDNWYKAAMAPLIVICQHQFSPAVTSSETSLPLSCFPFTASFQLPLAWHCSSIEACNKIAYRLMEDDGAYCCLPSSADKQ